MKTILTDQLEGYKKSGGLFTFTKQVGEKKTTITGNSDKMDWNSIENIILKTNIFDPKFDRKYKVEALTDDMNGTITYLYQSVEMTTKTKKINVITDAYTNDVTSLYIEYSDPGFLFTESYKILFVYGKFVQIQGYSKAPFQKGINTIQKLQF